MAVIYKLINVVTDAFYVGSAVNGRRRKWEHFDALKKQRHHCVALQAAWDLYGPDAFEFEVIEEVPEDRLLAVEDMWLQQHVGQPHCYNTLHTVCSPSVASPEVRKKISESLKRVYAEDPTRHPRYGTKHTEETKKKISERRAQNPVKYWAGKERSQSTKDKISATLTGRKAPPKKFTPEGLAIAQATMRKNARIQVPDNIAVVIAKFPKEVQDKYDFSQAVYLGALVRITGCVCPIHGVFSQYAARFRKGAGCPECGAVARGESKSRQMQAAWADPEQRADMMNARLKKTDEPQ